ncbi:efflux RND transporter permease subunit, partial [Oleiphilus sp. HI0067]|uniref:efflux RND transporter permease subunit n=1 Tax=Oleiphilus sp. HI0067 TaxID=1822243 RepID=UPI000A99DB3C
MDQKTSPFSQRWDFAVIGAGMAGAFIAGRLQAEGKSVLIIDKARGSGGRVSSKRLKAGEIAFGVDLGCQFFEVSHSYFEAYLSSREDVVLIGTAIQLLTNGVKVAEYRPDDTDEEVDINIRFPSQKRTLEALQSLRIQTNVGMVPLGNFVHLKPAPKTGTIKRADSRRAVLLQSEVEEGLLPTDKIQELFASIEGESFQPDVRFKLKGEQQDQQETMTFLGTAFILAIFLMLLILVIQFNSFYQSFLVLSAIVFSTFGVLLGLLITAQPFGVVMVGLGIIALAGIVVNNNIVLIDTYNAYIKDGYRPFDA